MPDNKHSIPFGGQEVSAVAVKVTNAGDGLSEAMRVDPIDLVFGQRVYLVTEGFVTKAEVAPANHLDPLGKVAVKYVIKAGTATFVDEGSVIAAIDLTRNRILAAQEAAADQQQIEGTERPVAGPPPEFREDGTDEDGFHDPALAVVAELHPEASQPSKRSHRKQKDAAADA